MTNYLSFCDILMSAPTEQNNICHKQLQCIALSRVTNKPAKSHDMTRVSQSCSLRHVRGTIINDGQHHDKVDGSITHWWFPILTEEDHQIRSNTYYELIIKISSKIECSFLRGIFSFPFHSHSHSFKKHTTSHEYLCNVYHRPHCEKKFIEYQ